MIEKRFYVDGVEYNVSVDPDDRLDAVLREQLGFSDVRNVCGRGSCGLCTVRLDGTPIRSCLQRMGQLPDMARIGIKFNS